jgi:hypothetical protein
MGCLTVETNQPLAWLNDQRQSTCNMGRGGSPYRVNRHSKNIVSSVAGATVRYEIETGNS